MGWVSPTGFSDPDNSWTNETNAYDKDISTYTDTSLDIGTWSGFLYFTLPSTIQSDKLRFNTFCHALDLIDVDAKVDGVWIDVYQGGIINNYWSEKGFTKGSVDEVRIRFYRDQSSAISLKRINEVAVREIVIIPSGRDALGIVVATVSFIAFIISLFSIKKGMSK